MCKAIKYNHIVLGDEIGENGTKHIQGYVEFKNQITFKSLKKQLPTAHIEERYITIFRMQNNSQIIICENISRR